MRERYWIIHFSNSKKMDIKDIADSTFGPFNKSEFHIEVISKHVDKSLLINFFLQK